MFYFKIFHSGHELNVVCEDAIENIVKLASYNDHVFVVTATRQLFYGTVAGDGPQVHFNRIRDDVIDVACSIDSIYVVDEHGAVQHCPLMAFEFNKRWNDIPILNCKY